MRPRKRRTSRRNPGACGCSPNPLPGRGTYPAPKTAKKSDRKVLPEVEQHPHSKGSGPAAGRSGPFEIFKRLQSAETARAKLLAKGSPYGFAQIRSVVDEGRRVIKGSVLEVPPNPGHPAWTAAGIDAAGRIVGPSGWAGAYDLAEQGYLLWPTGTVAPPPLPAPPAPPAPRYSERGQLALLPEKQLRLFNPTGLVIDEDLLVLLPGGRKGQQPRFAFWQAFATAEAARAAGEKVVGLFWNGPAPQGFAVADGERLVGANGSIPRANATSAGWTLRALNPSRARAARAAVVRLNAAESASLARGDRAFARRVLTAARTLAARHGSPVRVEDSAGVALLRVRAPR